MKRRIFLMMGTSAVAGAVLTACGGGGNPTASEASAAPRIKAVVAWNEAALQAVRVTRPGPPMAARSLAILHTAMYDAWAAYDSVAIGARSGGALRRPLQERSVANRQAAMSFAAYTALLDQFPTQKAAFDAQLSALGLDAAQLSVDLRTAQAVGTVAATAVLAQSHADGSNQLGSMTASGVPYADYTGYAPKNPPLVVAEPTPQGAIPAPGNWQPLSYNDAFGMQRTPACLGACWNRVAPFALESASQFRPAAPASPGSPEYLAQALRIIDFNAGLTEQQKVIAEYWSDGPSSELPPGHWCLFAQFVSSRDGHGDDDDVKMFFAMANALFDAGIAAWDAKFAYDSERPITAIRYLMHGKTVPGFGPGGPAAGLQMIAGETWTPYQLPTFPTPPFPEHVSGHSSFSAAAAEVLTRFTGSDAFGASYTRKAKSLLVEPMLPARDVTLEWATFSDAVAQAGLSRIYGGIHFDNANEAGKAMGLQVGARAFARAQQLWKGRA
jgi:PAP2 superfamily